MLPDDKISIIKENQILIGVLNPYENKDKLEILAKKINLFSLELLTKNYESSINGYIVIPSKFGWL